MKAAPFLPSNNRLKLVFRAVGGELWQGHNINGGSNAQRCRTGRLSIATMASTPEKSPRSSGKKVSRIEREAMVVSCVNKYRAQNGGKFPPTSVAHKEVGGSYYLVRDILQKITYDCSKHGPEAETWKNNTMTGSLTDSKIETSSKVEFPEDKILWEEVSSSHSRIEAIHKQTVEVTDVPFVGVTPEIVVEKSADGEPKRRTALNPHVSSLPSQVHQEDVLVLQEVVSTESSCDSTDVLPAHPQENISESIRMENEDEFNSTSGHLSGEVALDGKSEKSVLDTLKPSISSSKPADIRESSDLNRACRKSLSSNTMDDVGVEYKSPSLWSNLKYFAGSIISFWNKQ